MPEIPTKNGLLLGLLAWMLGFVLAFWALLFGAQALYYLDLLHYVYPLQRVIADSWLSGELPLWNPWVHCGCPLLGHGDQAYLYPLFAILLCADPVVTFPWYLLLNQVLGGVGMVWLLRGWRLPRSACMAAGLAFALTGVIVSSQTFPRFVIGAIWMPWVLGFFHRGLSGRRLNFLGAGAALAMQVIGGGTETCYFTGIAVGIYGLVGPGPTGVRARLHGAIFYPLLVGALGLLLSAAQLFPFLDYALSAKRAAGTGFEETAWALHPARSFEILAPTVFGAPRPTVTYRTKTLVGPRENLPWHITIYCGAVTVWLALIGVMYSKRQRVKLFLFLTGLASFLLATGSYTPLGPMFRAILPGIHLFRFAEKFVIGLSFAIALATACGWEAALSATRRQRRVMAGLGFLLALLVLTPLAVEWIASWNIFDTTAWLGLARASVVLVLGGLAALKARRGHWLALLPVFLIAVDLGLHGRRHYYSTQRESLQEPLWAVQVIRERSSQFPLERFFRYPTRAAFPLPRSVPLDGADRVIYQTQTLLTNSCEGKAYRVSGLGPGPVLRFSQYFEKLRSRPLRELQLLNVRFSLTKLGESPLPARKLVSNRELLVDISEYAGFAPRAYLAREARMTATLDSVYAWLLEDDFKVGEEVVLLGDPSVSPRSGDTGSCEITAYRAGEVDIVAQTPTGGYLVLSDAWDPGWNATVDGEPTPVLRANGFVRAVFVPPGSHDVVFSYLPWHVVAGITVSLVSWIGLAVVVILHRRKQRGNPADPPRGEMINARPDKP